MKKKLTLFTLIAIFLMLPMGTSLWACGKIVVFGDSLSDNGNADGYGFGVWTNGKVWVEYLADALGAQLDDRALGGAKTSGHESGSPDYGLDWQVDQYINQTPVGTDLSNTLFVVWAGGNDFLFMAPGSDPSQVIGDAITHIGNSVQDLIAIGAKEIVLVTLPDMGLAPLYKDNPQASAGATFLSETFNDYLKQSMCSLVNAFPNVKFYMVDTFNLLDYIVAHPTKFGFIDVDDFGNEANNWAGYVFWDGVHPTTAAHKIVAAAAYAQINPWGFSFEMRLLIWKLLPIHPRIPIEFKCYWDGLN